MPEAFLTKSLLRRSELHSLGWVKRWIERGIIHYEGGFFRGGMEAGAKMAAITAIEEKEERLRAGCAPTLAKFAEDDESTLGEADDPALAKLAEAQKEIEVLTERLREETRKRQAAEERLARRELPIPPHPAEAKQAVEIPLGAVDPATLRVEVAAGARILWAGDRRLIRFQRGARNVIALLNAFQNAGWEPGPEGAVYLKAMDKRQRLDLRRSLKPLELFGLSFRATGNGGIMLWIVPV